jgi:hypothetical protein
MSVKGTVEKAHTPTDLPKWDGFRGIKWGTDIKTLTGFDLKEMTPWKQGTYSRKNEEMTLGGAKLKEVQWLFYEGRLFQVGIITPDAGAFKALKEATERRYGKDYRDASHGEFESYTWTGITSDGKKVMLEMRGYGGLYTFFFVYTPIDEKKGQALDAYNTDAYIKTEAKKKQADEAAEKARIKKKQADEAAEMARSKKEGW